MARFLFALALLVFSGFALNDASALVAGKRVALVIGNSAYVHAVTLPNPVADGKLIAQTLRSVGFTVIEGSDLNKVDMGRLLDQFTEAAYDADIAVVYYAGHGLQVDGRNYLVPVDGELEKAAQLQTRTIPVDDVLNALPPDPAVGIDHPRRLPRQPVGALAGRGAAGEPLRLDGRGPGSGAGKWPEPRCRRPADRLCDRPRRRRL